jgi:hypothetical protein
MIATVGVSIKRGSGVCVGVSVGGVPVMVAVGLKPHTVGVVVNVGVGCVGVIVGVSVGGGTGVGDMGGSVAVGSGKKEKSGREQDDKKNMAAMKYRAFLMHTSFTL